MKEKNRTANCQLSTVNCQRPTTHLTILSFLLLSFSACTSPPTQAPLSPNLILIIADDMAWDDSGAYGHPSIRTPNIDRLAEEGMRFDQAFLTTSSCSPSRSSIITGTYPHQTDAEQLHWPLPPDKVTFVEKLKASGYWCAQAGKWHLGEAVKGRFDFLAEEDLADPDPIAENESASLPENDGSGCHLWLPTLNSRPEGKPFFLWLAAVDPHRGYADSIIAQAHEPEDVRIPPYMPDNAQVREDFTRYYDEISRMDDYIGQVMEALEDQGLAENTVILFITDNGRPFPRDKTTLYDGGIRTPFIVRWPGQVAAGSATDALVSTVDIAPTFLALAGLEAGTNFEGKNLTPVLMDPEREMRSYIYAEDHWHDHEDFTRAVRSKRFKYIRNFYPELPNTPPADALRSPTFRSMLELRDAGMLNEDQMAVFRKPRPIEELYDLAEDPFELNNLATDPDYTDTLKQMQAVLGQFRAETRDSLPPFRTPDEFDRESGETLETWQMPRPSKADMLKSPTHE